MTTLQSMQAILKANFDLAPEVLQSSTQLEDLAIDSLSVIEVMFAVEDEFKVTVPAKSMKLPGGDQNHRRSGRLRRPADR